MQTGRAIARISGPNGNRRGRVNIPESWILIGIVTAIPVAGLIAALIAAKVPSNRADT